MFDLQEEFLLRSHWNFKYFHHAGHKPVTPLTRGNADEFLLSILRPVGGALARYDLVDALSEAAVGGQPPRRLPQLLHAAVVGVGHGERLGVFHWNRRRANKKLRFAALIVAELRFQATVRQLGRSNDCKSVG